MTKKTLTDEQREQIVTLARAGTPRNEIARQLECSPGTVTRWAHKAGVAFDRAATAEAVAARQIDMQALRTDAAALGLTQAISAARLAATMQTPEALDKLGRAFASFARGHAELHRIDDHTDNNVEEVKAALLGFLAGAKTKALEIEARDNGELTQTEEIDNPEPTQTEIQP